MVSLKCILLATITMVAGWLGSARAQVVIDADFAEAKYEPVVVEEGSKGAMTGEIPTGWVDNSSWAEVWGNYQHMEQDGVKFLRITVSKVLVGQQSLAFRPLPSSDELEQCYHLRVVARSPTRCDGQFVFRRQGHPYTYFWSATPALGDQWRTYEYYFVARPGDEPHGLWISVLGTGRLDLAQIRLERIGKELFYRIVYGDPTAKLPPNLLRVTRYPLGLQSGAAVDANSDDLREFVIAPDPQVIGPGGTSALRIEAMKWAEMMFEPFAVPFPDRTYTASAYFRGSGSVSMLVTCDRENLGRQDFTLEDPTRWKRVSVTFKPKVGGKVYSIRLNVPGKPERPPFWVDALQVEEGREAKTWVSPMACEVALACPPSDTSAVRIQFADEPAEVRYFVMGSRPSGARLRVRVVSVYGQTQDLPPIPLGDRTEQPVQGTFRFDVFPKTPFGSFRSEVWVEDDQGRPISPFNELVVNRVPRPRYWGKDAPDSPFGVHVLPLNRMMLMAKAMGINWVRLHDIAGKAVYWASVEPQRGQWDFSQKSSVQRFRDYHLMPLGILATAPRWASSYPGAQTDYFDRWYQPTDVDAFANYVKRVVREYHGIIPAWCVWNEPWVPDFWAGYDSVTHKRRVGDDPAGDYAKLQKIAYRAVKEVDPTLIVLGCNTLGDVRGDRWLSGMLRTDKNIVDSCDGLDIHYYSYSREGFPDDRATQSFTQGFAPVANPQGQRAKPVWMTEGSGTSLRSRPGFYHYTLPYPNEEDVVMSADNASRFALSLFGQPVQKLFLYSMHTYRYFEQSSEVAALVTPEGFVHPSGVAFAAMAQHLEDMRFQRVVKLADGLYAYLFEARDAQHSVAVLSAQIPHASYTPVLSGNWTRQDLFGNPVSADQPVGNTLEYVSAAANAQELADRLTANH